MSNLLRFSKSNVDEQPQDSTIEPWSVLVVDDDQAIHDVTKLVLGSYKFDQRPLELTHVFSAEQAKAQLSKPNDFCVMLLDVVMETEHSGLDLVNFVRKQLNNQFLRIVLRTGQPGQAPEVGVMSNYDINDYRDKSDLTADKMISCMTAALRSFKDIKTIEQLAMTREKLSEQVIKQNQELSDINQQLLAEINMRSAAEKELNITNCKLESIINNSDAIISLKRLDGTYDLVNQAFVETLALKQHEIIGFKDVDLFDDDVWQALHFTDQEIIRTRRPNQYEELLPTKNGDHFYLCVKFPLFDKAGNVYRICSMCTDITERIDTQNELLRLSQFDALTNLPNRTLFIDRVSQVIARSNWNEKHVAIMFIDLDRFKQINDSLGHQVGDKLLQEVAKRLESVVRDGDSVSRLGGDEFAILLTELASEADIIRVAEKITQKLSEYYPIEGRDLIVTPSIGISRCPLDGNDVQSLLKKADVAMYKAKRAGRNTYSFYLKEDDTKAIEQLNLELDSRQMLQQMDEQLRLYYQPKVNLADGNVDSFEALIRWQHPSKGLVSPAEFIPMLEETGMIIEVGEWILHQACLFSAQCEKNGTPMKIAVNLSPKQFQCDQLITYIEQTLLETQCNPKYLELELTENALVDDVERIEKLLHKLANLGITLSIDDFGTGYSSFNYLKQFPFNTLKIDRSFIINAPQIKQEKAIVTTISQLAYNLGMTVVAEGVETFEQLELLNSLMQDDHALHIQGYFFSPPVEQHRALAVITDIQNKWQQSTMLDR